MTNNRSRLPGFPPGTDKSFCPLGFFAFPAEAFPATRWERTNLHLQQITGSRLVLSKERGSIGNAPLF